jgi:hypothetical protein
MTPAVDETANETKATEAGDFEPVLIKPEQLTRWLDCARSLGPEADAIGTALAEFVRDPVRHRLRRAAAVCRSAAKNVQDPRRRKLAEILATEIAKAANT